jgi:hypothetical protein
MIPHLTTSLTRMCLTSSSMYGRTAQPAAAAAAAAAQCTITCSESCIWKEKESKVQAKAPNNALLRVVVLFHNCCPTIPKTLGIPSHSSGTVRFTTCSQPPPFTPGAMSAFQILTGVSTVTCRVQGGRRQGLKRQGRQGFGMLGLCGRT